MARKKSATKPYVVRLHTFHHTTTARHFHLWAQKGLLVLLAAKLAVPVPTARVWIEDGQLQIAESEDVGPKVRTNAEVVERQFIFANAGQIPLPRGLEHEIRMRFSAAEADAQIAEYKRTARAREIALQFGF